VFLSAVRDLDSRAEAVEGARAGFVAQTFLRVALHRSPRQAARDVAAARALDPFPAGAGTAGEDPFADGEVHAPALGAVLAAGLASREHIDLGVRALGELPKGLRRQVDPDGVSVGAKADAYLAEQAQLMDPHTFRQVCAQLRAYLDPDHQRFDAEAYERRFLHLRVGEDGMVLLRGQLPADQGAVVKAALDAASAPQPAVEVVDGTASPRWSATTGPRASGTPTAWSGSPGTGTAATVTTPAPTPRSWSSPTWTSCAPPAPPEPRRATPAPAAMRVMGETCQARARRWRSPGRPGSGPAGRTACRPDRSPP
jgi:hypothetical protein